MFQGNFSVNAPVAKNQLLQMTSIYIEGFSGPPWNEIWESEVAITYLKQELDCSIVIIVNNLARKVIGFGLAKKLSDYKACNDFYSYGAKPDDFYITEVVVASNARKQGVANSIISIFDSLAHQSHQKLLFRTHVENEPMKKLALSRGMKLIGQYDAITGNKSSPRVIYRNN